MFGSSFCFFHYDICLKTMSFTHKMGERQLTGRDIGTGPKTSIHGRNGRHWHFDSSIYFTNGFVRHPRKRAATCISRVLRWGFLKPETHRGRLEAFGNTWTASIQHAKSENDHSDWRCASESARYVGGAEYCVCFVFLCTPFCHSLFPCFGVLAPPDVKETYCISCKRRTYTLLCSRQPSKRHVHRNFSAEQVRREATERSDRGSWLLVWVWAVCLGLNDSSICRKSCFRKQSTRYLRTWIRRVRPGGGSSAHHCPACICHLLFQNRSETLGWGPQ